MKAFGAAFQITVLVCVYECGLGNHMADIVAAYGMEPVTRFFQVSPMPS